MKLKITRDNSCYKDILGHYNMHYADTANEFNPVGCDKTSIEVEAEPMPWITSGDKKIVAYRLTSMVSDGLENWGLETPIIWVR